MATYNNTTRATLRGRIQERLINNFFTTAELNAYINEALRLWNALTGSYRQRSTSVAFNGYNAAAGSLSTVAAGNAFAILRMDLTSTANNWHLDPITAEDLADIDPNWLQTTTSGAPYYWIPQGLNRFTLYPSTAAQFNVFFDTLYLAAVPQSDGDFIQIAEEDMDAIIDYVSFLCALKEGGEETAAAVTKLTNFLKQAAKYNSRLQNMAIFRKLLGMPGGGQRSQRPKDKEGMAPR